MTDDDTQDRPPRRPRSPHACPHEQGEKREGDEIMDGKGNVIGWHIRCTECGIIIDTERHKGRER